MSTEVKEDERRVCDRTQLARKMRLQLADGRVLDCITEDISLGGVLMAADEKWPEGLVGQGAELFIVHKGKQSAGFSCLITRATGLFISVELDRKLAAAFGKELTKGMFKR
jgi:hypothetical protein